MQITEVKVRLAEDRTERLRGFCTVTLDNEFVVRDIKIIDGAKGLFVAMPSRKVTDHCTRCRGKNHLRAKYCNDCGAPLPGNRNPDPTEGSSKLHVDVAHPINSECRSRFQGAILSAFHEEVEKAKQQGYVPPTFDELDHGGNGAHHAEPAHAAAAKASGKPFGEGIL